MYKRLFWICIFVAVTLTSTQFATADYRVTNGSTTETASVIYSVWRPASGVWPAGWRTEGYYNVAPGATRNLSVPSGNTWVYIYVERGGSEIKPDDHATRESAPFYIHPSLAFTVVETNEGNFLRSNRDRWSLEIADLYQYRNGGSHTIVDEPRLPDLSAQEIYDQAINSVVLLYNSGNVDENGVIQLSQGSGFLIDKARRLVVTNEHVVRGGTVLSASFPVENRNGKLIGDRDYYEDETNFISHARQGRSTQGRVIATDTDRDLAILQLDFLPDNVREINHNFNAVFKQIMETGSI